MSKATLVIMAAGLGSRFGSAKQLEPIGPNGEILINYSVYDAVKSGFDKVVFIIREEHYEAFKRDLGDRVSKMVEVDYVFQDMSDLPEGRKKPWGTAHAIMCCKDTVKEPFAVINSDDYYGKHAYTELYRHLTEANENEFAMVGFSLKNTVTENGTVSRGVCEIEDGRLKDVVENYKVDGDLKSWMPDGSYRQLSDDTVVSMNLWGFTPYIFKTLEEDFINFKNTKDTMKDEYLIPFEVDKMIKSGAATVKVFHCPDKWYGMTYREDLPAVKAAIKELTDKGEYDGI